MGENIFFSSCVFSVIFCFRIISAIYSHITDCDETYNYWEPSHYLLFGNGFQPWEYSPQFALRSYLYILIYNAPAWIFYKVFHPSRLFLFYLTRCCLAAFCAICETFFYRSVCREFSDNVGRIMLVILLFSPGMFIACTAFLPSSFSMYMTMLSMSSWFDKKYPLAVFFVAVSSLLSWPFAGIIGSPIAFEIVFLQKRWRQFLKWCILSAIIILIPLSLTDYMYYGKFTLTPWNIIKYNIFTSQGPNLYGKSPWYFYILNGFLNFNISFLFALSTPLLLIWIKMTISSVTGNRCGLPYILSLGSLYLWFIVFFTQPHKEERFLFPVYPLIALCGAIGMDRVQMLWYRYFIKGKLFHYVKVTQKISIIALICYVLLGVSRILLMYKSYHAPTFIYGQLKTVKTTMINKNEINLCIGKEWHRFPSSYFLPDGWTVNFIKTEFRGQLPAHYLPSKEASKIVRTDMNDLNKEQVSRYVNLNTCDYLVDLDSVSPTPLEPMYSRHSNWTSVYSIQFLDGSRTPLYARSFYIPILWEWQSVFSDYFLLKRNENT
ncbi:alpha-1,2-mannosyltransferase ALG9-like [Planococcus citri]|uniref:alpha-1,2-mannosyltransferase ALG9-like n=1 Tax=Planococcus citri TaxID=170843 RepID=UPI0031F9B072